MTLPVKCDIPKCSQALTLKWRKNAIKMWLNDCLSSFKPLVYRRYVDNIFVLISSSTHIDNFVNYFNSKHHKINFKSEAEKDNTFSFLDILV